MSDTESFESVYERLCPQLHNPCGLWKAATIAEWLDDLERAHDREIRDVSHREYHRGFEGGRHSMDAEHRAVAMRLRHLPLDGGSHENLSQIARAVYHSDWGWTQGACAALRDELVRLMGGVNDDTAEPMTTDEFIKYVEEDTRRLKGDASKVGDGNDTCDSQCRGACAVDCGGGHRKQAEVSDGGTADDCGADFRGGAGCDVVHMDGLVAYDVLWNERQKAVRALRRWKPEEAIDNDHCGEIQIRLLYQFLGLGGAMMMDGADAAKKVRDRLIHLLGGDECNFSAGESYMNAMGEKSNPAETSCASTDHVILDTPLPDDGTSPNDDTTSSITDELRKWADGDVWSCKWEEFKAIADRIDERAKHDRESDRLRIEKLVEKRDELRLIIADVIEERDMWKAAADTNANTLLRMGSENTRLHAECDKLRKRLDSITEAIECIKSLGQE